MRQRLQNVALTDTSATIVNAADMYPAAMNAAVAAAAASRHPVS